MTRVNLVHVEDLADQHLFAEWRELKMIPAKVRKNLANAVPMDKIPVSYTLSTGHVKFFYNKMDWLYIRHRALTTELKKREFNISEFNSFAAFLHEMPDDLKQSIWSPTLNEIKINIDRISQRLLERPNWYRYYGEIKSPQFFIDRYNHQLVVDNIIAS